MPANYPEDPQANETYLCVVSEWHGGRNSGNCYPIFVLSQSKTLTDPEGQFPNAGAIFMPSRVGKAFDFVSVRPIQNRTYTNQSYRDCYFVPMSNSVHLLEHDETPQIRSILTVAHLDSDARRLESPAQMVTPVFFVRDMSRGARLVGPLRRLEVRRSNLNESIESIAWRADSADGLAWVLPPSALETNKLKLEVYAHPNPELNEVLRQPFELLVGKINGRMEGGEPIDLAAPEDLVRFYVQTAGLELSPETLSALEAIPTNAGADSPSYLRSRHDRLSRLLRSARELEDHRHRIASEFLKTEEGERQKHAEIAKAKAEARAEMQAKLEEERKHVSSQIDEIKAQRASLARGFDAERTSLETEIKSLRKLKDGLTADLRASASELEARVIEGLPGLVALTAVRTDKSAHGELAEPSLRSSESRPALQIEPALPKRPFRPVEDEALYVRWLKEQLALAGLHFSLEMVANIFVCLKCSTLSLIGGPPGVGKSSLVRTLPVLLGQEHCFLELSVRRTWADDRALLGFPDVFHKRYEPGTTGLVPHLVRAMRDHASESGGIYMVLLDEFNLAPPEYYFSEFLRVLQKSADDRSLRLYTQTPGMESDPIPPEVTVGPNVSFWGTVNLDETTEALSPRLLDRVQFVILGAEDIEVPGPSALDKTPRASTQLGPFGYADLAQSRLRNSTPNPDAERLVHEALQVLRDPRSDWGVPTAFFPRQIREVRRYLEAARPVLTATAAADLVLNQRVLPSLRGRGEAFRQRIEELQRALRTLSLKRSASRLERILAHADENYQAFDFHVY